MTAKDAYERDGHALIEGLLPAEVCNAFLSQLKRGIEATGDGPPAMKSSPLLTREAVELYGYRSPPMLGMLWGLTAAVSQLLGRALLPTYSYFRIYREGDICRVHSDRFACEVSLSLTLGNSGGLPWNLDIGLDAVAPAPAVYEDFGGAPFRSVPMRPGDGLVYQGVDRRHGRITPNPNRWSAHLFCHWVERDGPYAARAFDGREALGTSVDFSFG